MFAGIRKQWLVIGALAALVIAGGSAGGIAVATGMGDDNEQPITGEALDKASQAALEYTGEGRVSETEAGDEDSYYEVEVTLDDGSQVDVQLDEDFNVVGGNADDDGAGDDEGDSD